MFRTAAVAACLLALTGCDIIYTSPDVEKRGFLGLRPNTDFNVDVIDLTYETAVAANLEPYVPQRLPAAFQPEAVAAARSRGNRSIGLSYDLPGTGVMSGQIAERLPPRLEPRPYTIGVADTLLLSVNAPTSLEDLPALIESAAKRQGYVVQDDGAIAIPDVGRVIVAGLTLQDAEAAIFDAVAAAGIDPSFTVEIAEFNSKGVAVGGLVGNPSVVPITLRPLYLNEALQLAGGIATADPSTTEVQIFRGGREYRLSAERLLNTPGLQRFLLLEGDTVFVTSAFYESRLEQQFARDRELFLQRVELGAVPRQYAYLTGEVRNPSRFPLPFESQANLNDVLFGGGRGINIRNADYEQIYVIRGLLGPDQFGSVRAYHLDAENAVNLVAANLFLIRPNDVVFVAEQPVTAWNRTISQIIPNLVLDLPSRLQDFADPAN